jgi:hypothetical protein
MKSTTMMSWIPEAKSRQNPPHGKPARVSLPPSARDSWHRRDRSGAAEREGKWSIADVIARPAIRDGVRGAQPHDPSGAAGDVPLPALRRMRGSRTHRREPVAELFEQLWFHRRMNLAFHERLSEEERKRTGVHPQYGAISIDDARVASSATMKSTPHRSSASKRPPAREQQPQLSEVAGAAS